MYPLTGEGGDGEERLWAMCVFFFKGKKEVCVCVCAWPPCSRSQNLLLLCVARGGRKQWGGGERIAGGCKTAVEKREREGEKERERRVVEKGLGGGSGNACSSSSSSSSSFPSHPACFADQLTAEGKGSP